MDLEDSWTGFIWLRAGWNVGLMWLWQWTHGLQYAYRQGSLWSDEKIRAYGCSW